MAFGLAGGLTVAAALALAPRTAAATPMYPNGSIAYSTAGNGFTNTDGIDQIDAFTTQIVVSQPGFSLNPSTGNLNIPALSFETMGPAVGHNVVIAIPTHAIVLGTPLTVSVGGFSFAFDREEPNGVPVTGNIGVKLAGYLMESPAGYTPLANQDADLSITFTESSHNGSVGAAYSLDTPATFRVNVPEPASMALLGSALFGLGLTQRRKLKRNG